MSLNRECVTRSSRRGGRPCHAGQPCRPHRAPGPLLRLYGEGRAPGGWLGPASPVSLTWRSLGTWAVPGHLVLNSSEGGDAPPAVCGHTEAVAASRLGQAPGRGGASGPGALLSAPAQPRSAAPWEGRCFRPRAREAQLQSFTVPYQKPQQCFHVMIVN